MVQLSKKQKVINLLQGTLDFLKEDDPNIVSGKLNKSLKKLNGTDIVYGATITIEIEIGYSNSIKRDA